MLFCVSTLRFQAHSFIYFRETGSTLSLKALEDLSHRKENKEVLCHACFTKFCVIFVCIFVFSYVEYKILRKVKATNMPSCMHFH